ncbi:MAG: histidinol-phosphate transaminase [Saprospiraceae bacterium]|nr:histidinol-phosphate transaminase [Saprospiraceae bacterium]
MTIETLVRPNIRALSPYSSARSEFKGKADIFIDANENPFETGLNRYPDPLQWKLKEQISKIKKAPVENIFLGNGSDEVIDLLIRIFCEPRVDHVLSLPPTYGMYKVSAGIADVEIKQVLLTEDFQPRVDETMEVVNEHTKILFLCSPNNPTANDMDPSRVEALLEQFPGIVVIDEAYIDFSQQASFIHHIEKYPNLLVMQTFSKAWGLAGIRLGMAFASTEIIQYLNKVKPPYNINQLTQSAALEALQDTAKQSEWVKTLLAERDSLSSALAEFDFIQKVYPSNANFIMGKVERPQELYQFLVQRGIIVRDRSNVPLCEGCLRFTVGRPDENQQLLAALKEYTT